MTIRELTQNWLNRRFPGQANRWELIGYDDEENIVRIEDRIGKPGGHSSYFDVPLKFMQDDLKLINTLDEF